MSTLFAMSQIALFGRDINTEESTTPSSSSTPSSAGPSTTESSAAVGWSMPESSASSTQPARWRINSGDLEEMMRRAAAGLGLDRGSNSNNSHGVEDHHGSSSPLSREDLAVEERENHGSMMMGGFPNNSINTMNSNAIMPAPTESRGSSPLYRKHHHAASEYQLENTLDTTAPSSPCTPSVHMRSVSAVSPTSSRSEEAAFQQRHQLSPEGNGRHTAARPGAAVALGQQGGGSSASGRFGLKLLVSNSMAGTLIGKGGTRICEIKDECLADIKVTPNGRFYPGTHERVVLVVGEPGSVQMACDRIVTTIYTAADTSLDITQRVLIPDAASGLIIGHDGVRLGDLRQEAGVVSIQVSPRDMCTVAGERVVTLQGPMSAVILGLTLIVDRMMEDTTASRYQNMSTIYRAVHLHLPPYAAPGMHDGSSPRHPDPRLSPSYGGPSPHSQHDFHSPGTVGGNAAKGSRRDYSNAMNGTAHWEVGCAAPRELASHGATGSNSAPVEYARRSLSMPLVHPHEMSSPVHHRSHTAPSGGTGSTSAHFGGRHLRQQQGSVVDMIARDFDFNDGDMRSGRLSDLDDLRREYDSPSPADLGGRPGSREASYLHHSPRLPGPSPRDLDHMRQQQQQQHGGDRGFGGRGTFPGVASSQPSDYLALQQQRLHQQQQLARSSADYSHQQDSTASMLAHEAVQQQHRGMTDGGSSSLRRTCSGSVHGGGSGALGSPPHGVEARRCHSVAVGGGGAVGDSSGLAGMFDSMNLNSPHGMQMPQGSSVGVLQQHQPQQQQQQQQVKGGATSAGCIVHGELPVPDADVGIILGKGGATVRELQQLSGAKIMIARRNEFMPGTKHRLVTLAGPPLAVNMARFLIMRKIQTEKEKL